MWQARESMVYCVFQYLIDPIITYFKTLSPCEQSKFNLKKKSTHNRIWCQRICLSVCLTLSVMNFDLNYLRTGEIVDLYLIDNSLSLSRPKERLKYL